MNKNTSQRKIIIKKEEEDQCTFNFINEGDETEEDFDLMSIFFAYLICLNNFILSHDQIQKLEKFIQFIQDGSYMRYMKPQINTKPIASPLTLVLTQSLVLSNKNILEIIGKIDIQQHIKFFLKTYIRNNTSKFNLIEIFIEQFGFSAIIEKEKEQKMQENNNKNFDVYVKKIDKQFIQITILNQLSKKNLNYFNQITYFESLFGYENILQLQKYQKSNEDWIIYQFKCSITGMILIIFHFCTKQAYNQEIGERKQNYIYMLKKMSIWIKKIQEKFKKHRYYFDNHEEKLKNIDEYFDYLINIFTLQIIPINLEQYLFNENTISIFSLIFCLEPELREIMNQFYDSTTEVRYLTLQNRILSELNIQFYDNLFDGNDNYRIIQNDYTGNFIFYEISNISYLKTIEISLYQYLNQENSHKQQVGSKKLSKISQQQNQKNIDNNQFNYNINFQTQKQQDHMNKQFIENQQQQKFSDWNCQQDQQFNFFKEQSNTVLQESSLYQSNQYWQQSDLPQPSSSTNIHYQTYDFNNLDQNQFNQQQYNLPHRQSNVAQQSSNLYQQQSNQHWQQSNQL